jgi:capsular polysaccharide biosynthesis protein
LDRPVNKQGNLLSGAKITSEGVVIDCDGKYDFRKENFDMLVWQSFENKDLIRDEYLKKLDSYVLNELKSDFLYLNLLSHFGRYVYGHFFDVLSKSLRFKSLDNIVCLINDNPRNLINQLTRQLWLLGIRNVILVPPKSILHVPKLLNLPLQAYPSQISKEDQYLIYKKFTAFFAKSSEAPRLKIYLSRNANNPNLQMVGTRNVLNDIELIGYLKTKGFVVITGEEDLGYITEIFSRCVFLISIHGSGIRNMMFSDYENFVLELYPSKFKTQNERAPDNTIANLCVSRNSVYKQLVVDSDEDFNMNVDIDLIRPYVELFD